jgi:hypothetical protein
VDDFAKSPTSALRFISLSLRRTISTPRDTRLARLEFGTFYKVVCKSTFYERINVGLTTLRIAHKINSSGVQTTLSNTGQSPDTDQKFYWHRPHGRAGVRDMPDRPETLTITAALG